MRAGAPGSDRESSRLPWHEVTKVQHYYLTVDAMTGATQVPAEQNGLRSISSYDMSERMTRFCSYRQPESAQGTEAIA